MSWIHHFSRCPAILTRRLLPCAFPLGPCPLRLCLGSGARSERNGQPVRRRTFHRNCSTARPHSHSHPHPNPAFPPGTPGTCTWLAWCQLVSVLRRDEARSAPAKDRKPAATGSDSVIIAIRQRSRNARSRRHRAPSLRQRPAVCLARLSLAYLLLLCAGSKQTDPANQAVSCPV